MITLLIAIATTQAAGIDCGKLPHWSSDNPQVNLHHIFCGEKNRSGRAVGYHANPGGNTPSTFVSVGTKGAPNAAGLATWRQITLNLKGSNLVKPLSTMFPNSCTQNQVVKSIVYASKNATGSCASPGWAKCGPSAPSSGDRNSYCLGKNGSVLTIATAAPRNNKINTGFPIQ
ncbi:EndoU domain-containing protein [Candidatus Entotheonella palauensis]|uniref:EndoU domain-containing protein n=1 Tax=Candidatus Entotheonella palauensis TaxID=93172 RepID=UPI0034DE88D2